MYSLNDNNTFTCFNIIKMIEILLNGLLWCLLIPDVEEFGQCLDEVVLEYNLSLDDTNG